MSDDVTWLAGSPLAPSRPFFVQTFQSLSHRVLVRVHKENRLVPYRVLFTGVGQAIKKAPYQALLGPKTGFSWVRIWVRSKSILFVFNNLVASNRIFSHFLAFPTPVPFYSFLAPRRRQCEILYSSNHHSIPQNESIPPYY